MLPTREYDTLACDIQDRILTVRLNRPEQLNAFTVQMAEELIAVFEAASEDDAVGCIVVTGNGRAFCAGMDLSALARQMLLKNSRTDPLSAHKIESLAMFYSSIGPGKEGVASFLEKRAPVYREQAGSDMPAFYPWW